MANDHTNAGRRLRKCQVCQERFAKVQTYCYLYKLKDDEVGAGRPIPWLNLKGHWLKVAGFDINSPIRIRVTKGCIVLTVEE